MGGAKIPRKNGTGVQISQGFHFSCDTGLTGNCVALIKRSDHIS